MVAYSLNSEQQAIVNHINGAILVLAPVGTGKTSVLSERVFQAIDQGISADRILCLTFTNRAAKEMCDRLTDLALAQPFINDDPLGNLLETYTTGSLVVFDVETTGVSISDDIIEIAAIQLVNGQPQAEFHAYISDAADVGNSQYIHGYSDLFLRQNGQPAHQVLNAFCRFAADAMLVGHNVGFDIKMVTAHTQKVGIQVPIWQWADTWNLAHRFIQTDSYSLENLAAQLGLTSIPNHQAMADVRTTVELLESLIPLVKDAADYRQAIVYKYGEVFEPLAQEITTWKKLGQTLRPAELLTHILQNSGLERHYASSQQRSQNLKRLIRIFQERDDAPLHPETALRNLLEFTALAKNLDQLSEQDNQVVIITAHQSKGLEFDNVFIAGMSEEEFPGYFSIQNGNLEEEKRLFYVALTRAKERLFTSCFTQDSQGYSRLPSRFLKDLPKQYEATVGQRPPFTKSAATTTTD